jgi:hypothetical protein
MEIKIKPTKINLDLLPEDGPTQYIDEDNGVNFQTPICGAELKINLNTLTIQSSNPTDTMFTSTSFTVDGKVLGFSCMSRSFLGKEVSLTTEEGVYFGVLDEEETKLSLQD